MPMPLRLSLLHEDVGGTPFDQLISAHYRPTPPEDVRDRIELPALSPDPVHDAVDRAVRGFTRRPGRHNRYMPVPGEHSLRTDDIVDFLVCYGHEYRLALFRAADIRTGSLLDVTAVQNETARQGSACAWDWTGAVDWLSLDALPHTAAFVYWSTHTSLVDGVDIPAGWWIPGDEVPPASLRHRTAFTGDEIERMRGLSAAFAASLHGTSVRHPGRHKGGLPVVVLHGGARADATADVLGASGALLAVIRHGEELTVVTRPEASTADMIAVAEAAAAAGKES